MGFFRHDAYGRRVDPEAKIRCARRDMPDQFGEKSGFADLPIADEQRHLPPEQDSIPYPVGLGLDRTDIVGVGGFAEKTFEIGDRYSRPDPDGAKRIRCHDRFAGVVVVHVDRMTEMATK